MQDAPAVVAATPFEIKLSASDEARFWSKVNKNGPAMREGLTNCWVWTAGKDKDGYGKFWVRGDTIRSHRVSLAVFLGGRLSSPFALHHCDNPSCVRPDHLFEGTLIDNVKDAMAKGRVAIGSRHGSVTHPERLKRGYENGSRLYPERLKRGTDQHKAKLTDDQVREIRARRAAGETLTSIAPLFSITIANAGYICKGKTWAHLL